MNDLEKKSIECLKNMPIEETTYQVARNVVLDCITNLQERKITKEDVDKYFEENMCVSFDKFIENWDAQEEWANFYKKKYENLKEENKELKKKITFNEKSRRKMQQSLMEQIETNKSRNEKAIEYIKQQDMKYYGAVVDNKMKIILDILQGEDKDE